VVERLKRKPKPLKAEAYLAAVVESSDDAIIANDRHAVITSWNPAAERLLGYSPADAVGMDTALLFPPDHRDIEAHTLARVWTGETIVHFETELMRQDGATVPVSLTVSPVRDGRRRIIGASKIVRDMRRQQGAELAALRLAAIVESSDDAIISKDLNGIVTSWNTSAERMFGYTSAEMVGTSITRIIPAERIGEEAFVLGRIRAGQRLEHFETVRQTKDGRRIEISLTVSPIRNDAGTVIGVSKIARDITEHNRLLEVQRAAEAAQEAARRELLEAENRRVQEASRLKGEFVANMSHELRTPLNSIIGFAELIADQRYGPAGARYPGFAARMLTSARHLLQLINDILDLAKVESGKIDLHPQRVDLPALVRETTEIIAGIAKKRDVSVEVDVDPAIEVVEVDPARLKQVLYNYLSNAIKFSRTGGRVLVRVRAVGDDQFRIEVQDWGIGIRPEDQHKLFIEFQQLDASTSKQFPGTGLGLALTRRLVESQGGTVGFESTFGEGSTFTAILPTRVNARTADLTSRAARA
jgi:PAS domain S-box-containing protein